MGRMNGDDCGTMMTTPLSRAISNGIPVMSEIEMVSRVYYGSQILVADSKSTQGKAIDPDLGKTAGKALEALRMCSPEPVKLPEKVVRHLEAVKPEPKPFRFASGRVRREVGRVSSVSRLMDGKEYNGQIEWEGRTC